MNISKVKLTDSNLFIGLLLLMTAALYAQPPIDWEHTYGGSNYEELQAMNYAGDGYIFAGNSSSEDFDVMPPHNGFSDAWVFKTNVTGDVVEWQNTFGCEGFEHIWDILPLDNGDFFLIGQSASDACPNGKTEDSRGGDDYWLIKIDADGNYLWDKTYGGEAADIARKILPTDDGNFLIGGFSYSQDFATTGIGERTVPNRGEADYWLVKIDSDGNKIADYVYGGTPQSLWEGDDWLYDMKKMPDGTFLLAGWSESNGGFEKTNDSYGRNDYWLIQIDQNGQKVTNGGTKDGDYIYGGNSVDALQEVLITIDGGILLVGESFSQPFSDTGIGSKTTPHYGAPEADEDLWIVKLNPAFEIVWQRTYGGNSREIPHVVWENRSGKLWIAGDSVSPASGNKEDDNINGSKDIWMLLLTPDGDKIWEQTYGGDGSEAPEEILPAHDGGYIIGAHSDSNQSQWKSEDSRGFNDFWIIKTDCSLYDTELDIETNVCLGEPFPLAPEFEGCDDCEYIWLDGTTDTVRIVSLTENTDFEILVTDADGCEDEGIVQTIVQSNPEILELENIPPTCTDDTDGSLSILEASGLTPHEFSLNGSDFSTVADFDNLPAGDYQITLRDSIGCLADTTINLPNPLEPLIDIGNDTIIELGDSILVQVITSPGVDTFIWQNPDLVSCADCPFTYIRPTQHTRYQITGYNAQGCAIEAAKSVAVKRETPFYAPTAFSPDNNGDNEFFMLFPGDGIIGIKNFSIYNRWGEIMHRRENVALRDPRDGWNGNYRGKSAPTGVYVWAAEVEFLDGRTEVFQGDFTLMR